MENFLKKWAAPIFGSVFGLYISTFLSTWLASHVSNSWDQGASNGKHTVYPTNLQEHYRFYIVQAVITGIMGAILGIGLVMKNKN